MLQNTLKTMVNPTSDQTLSDGKGDIVDLFFSLFIFLDIKFLIQPLDTYVSSDFLGSRSLLLENTVFVSVHQ